MRSRSLLAVVVMVSALTCVVAPAGAADSRRHRVDLNGVFKLVGIPGPGQIEDEGTVRGKPMGSAAIRMVSTFAADGTVTGKLTMQNKRGRVLGAFAGTYVISGNEIDIDGLTQLTGGRGRYRGIAGRNLPTQVHDTLDGQNGTLTVDGFARF